MSEADTYDLSLFFASKQRVVTCKHRQLVICAGVSEADTLLIFLKGELEVGCKRSCTCSAEGE